MGRTGGGSAAAWRRPALTGAVVLAVLAAAGLVGYRVLRPAEVSTVVWPGYPPVTLTTPDLVGALTAAPLVVADGRLRIFAAPRQLRADPVDARSQRSAHWSYRRWPARLAGVAAVGATVLSRWSDGLLVALDAADGRVRWRSWAPPPAEPGPDWRRTGAPVLLQPEGLWTARSTGGAVVLVAGAGQVAAHRVADGRRLWSTALDRCHGGAFTTEVGELVLLDTCADRPELVFRNAETGTPRLRWRPPAAVGAPRPAAGDGPAEAAPAPATADPLEVTPLGCAAHRSGCTAVRVHTRGGATGWLLEGPAPIAAPALDPPSTWRAGPVAVLAAASADELTARPVGDAETGWTWRASGAAPDRRATVVGATPTAVHLLTGDRRLVTLDAATGRVVSRVYLVAARAPETGWRPGAVHVRGRFVVIERLRAGARHGAPDEAYYDGIFPVLLVRT